MTASYYETAEPYQTRVENFILDNPRCAVWADMGLRKTGIALGALRMMLGLGMARRALVVGPKRVIEHQWPNEMRKWREFHELTFTLLRGNPSWRMSLTARETDVHLINYELWEWLCNSRARRWPYDIVIFDEADSLKSADSVRWKVADKLVKFLDHNWDLEQRAALRVVELTGTPSTAGLKDIWAPVCLLDDGAALGRTYDAFKMRWFMADPEKAYGIVPRPGKEDEIHRRVAHLTVSLNTDDYLNLPDMVVNDIKVTLPPRARQQYETLEREAVVALAEMEGGVDDLLEDLDNEDDGVPRVRALTAAAKVNRCLQMAAGAIYLQDEMGAPTTEWKEVHKAKLEALDEVIGEANGAPVLVVYWYKHDLTRLQARYPHGRVIVESNENIDAWNRGEVQVGFLSASAGYGLNLQDGGNIIAWFSPVWSLRLWLQTNKRLHRSGQTKPVFVHRLLAENTFDEDVPLRHAMHAATQTRLMRMVAEYRRTGQFDRSALGEESRPVDALLDV